MTAARWLLWLAPAWLQATATHYAVTVHVDIPNRTLHGKEFIRFSRAAGAEALWENPEGLTLHASQSHNGRISVTNSTIRDAIVRSGEQRVEFEYSAKDTRGLHWFGADAGVFTTFYCSAFMICSMSPSERATLSLEIVFDEKGYHAVGPGVERRCWQAADGQHCLFETLMPVQTYLLSFAVAPLQSTRSGKFEVLATRRDRKAALEQTQAAADFFRLKTGLDPLRRGYREAFLPQPGLFGQEAAQMALMTDRALSNLEMQGDVVLMAHEMAHQWWGVSIGIKSWSDFWLNEGFAEYFSLTYLEQMHGKAAFAAEIAKLAVRLRQLTASGPDRPLHFEGWKDANDALGEVPYVKGALFLNELRLTVGDAAFWNAIARYSQRNAGKLVDSSDLERAFRDVAPVDVRPLFARAVYGEPASQRQE